MKAALVTVAGLVTALAWGCTTTVVHISAAPPDGGSVDDSGNVVDPDAGTDPPDTSPPACVYPSGPYGSTAAGQVVAPNWTWQGYLKGVDTVTTLKITDLYDCDGTKGINAILVDEAALWCGPCNQEASDELAQMNAAWTAQGVAAVTLLVQDLNRNTATTANALSWRNQYGLGPVANVMTDPGYTFEPHTGNIGLPTNVLIDPRTMKIVSWVPGYGGIDPAVSALALKNKK